MCPISSFCAPATDDVAHIHEQGNVGERMSAHFVGGGPKLKLEEVVYTQGDRFRLQVSSACSCISLPADVKLPCEAPINPHRFVTTCTHALA